MSALTLWRACASHALISRLSGCQAVRSSTSDGRATLKAAQSSACCSKAKQGLFVAGVGSASLVCCNRLGPDVFYEGVIVKLAARGHTSRIRAKTHARRSLSDRAGLRSVCQQPSKSMPRLQRTPQTTRRTRNRPRDEPVRAQITELREAAQKCHCQPKE